MKTSLPPHSEVVANRIARSSTNGRYLSLNPTIQRCLASVVFNVHWGDHRASRICRPGVNCRGWNVLFLGCTVFF